MRILIVDDEPYILKAIARLLHLGLPSKLQQKVSVESYCDPLQALDRAREVPFALVMSDYRMPHLNGVELLKEFKQLQPDSVRMILSGYVDLGGLISAINEVGISRFAAKPWVDHELLTAVQQGLEIYELNLENRRLLDEVKRLSGAISPQEAELRRLERLEPGITQVNWAADGSIILDPLGLD